MVHLNLLVMFFKLHAGCYGKFALGTAVGICERIHSEDLKCERVFPSYSRKEPKLLSSTSDLRYQNTTSSMLNCCVLLQQ